jgi:benzoyl-CoA reductase/2-hydroxyglutaryl-CoA dehydratase subunit BcrC/BadD/HgdB
MSKGQLWETRPLDCWKKAKELRAEWQSNIDKADKIVGQGNTYFVDWQEAFPAIRIVEDNPAGAMIASQSSPFARKCRLACERTGWGREICGYHGNIWGSQFLGYQVDGSPFPKRHFVVPFPCVCDSHAKRGQQVRDFENVPQWMMDQNMYLGPRDEEREVAMNEHKAFCTLKNINDMERIFGQKFDDEKMVELIRSSGIMREYQKQITEIMAKTKPTPLSVKDMYSFYTLGFLTRIDPQKCNDFWKMVRDEVQWRADNHIAAVGNERFRWIETHPPAWHFLKYYRYMEKYGAVCMGSQYTNAGADYKEIPRIVYPEDTPLETREDAIRYSNTPDARQPVGFKQDEYMNRPPYGDDVLIKFAKYYQADGALLALWRCGVGCTLTRKEQAMRLRQAGFSVLHYEGSQPGDRTDLDEKRFLGQLDSWMQSLGLEMLDD